MCANEDSGQAPEREDQEKSEREQPEDTDRTVRAGSRDTVPNVEHWGAGDWSHFIRTHATADTDSLQWMDVCDTHSMRDTSPAARPFRAVSEAEMLRELGKYRALVETRNIPAGYRLSLGDVLGQGSQGTVFRAVRHGQDGFLLPVAVKLLFPDAYGHSVDRNAEMEYMASVMLSIANLQSEYLLDICNWYSFEGIRMIEMKLVHGFDLGRLMTNRTLQRMREKLDAETLARRQDAIIRPGRVRPMLMPGVALSVIRDCLCGLSALHEAGIVHSDVKPSNIMLRTSGHATLIDTGSAFFHDNPLLPPSCSPRYAAPELTGTVNGPQSSPQSDIASLGYVLIELLSGQDVVVDGPPGVRARHAITHQKQFDWLREQKQAPHIFNRIDEILPEHVKQNKELVALCRKMVHPNPRLRYQSAQDVIVENGTGIGSFHRSLVPMKLASEYDRDLLWWVRDL